MTLIYAALLVLCTWLLNLFFRKWFDIVLWPMLGDWWASWSEKRLQKKIWSLQKKLRRQDKFEDVVIYGFTVILNVLILLMTLIAAWAPESFLPALFRQMPEHLVHWTGYADTLAWTRVILTWLIFLLALLYSGSVSTRYRHWKYSDQYQWRLERRIKDLREQLHLQWDTKPKD